ncbi:MAG TPA: molybdopterin molybdotransferase MoeA [Saprospiraceae bacterium]|nr:molybdopterin molybdotransferase MoeA [Saprospiraceae bacterium]
MISSKEAHDIIYKCSIQFEKSKEELTNACGLVLATEVTADRPFPPFDRVCMDGIAISSEAFKNGQVEFRIQSTQAAGQPPHSLNDSNHCIEIMTGAVLPKGTDAVIRYEDLELKDGLAKVQLEEVRQWQNVQKTGIERLQGDVLLSAPQLISPAQVAVLATVGKAEIDVVRWPEIAIVSNGDELVEIDETPEDHQIRKSNVYALQALCKKNRWPSKTYHLSDNREEIQKELNSILRNHRLILMSGGVSKGKFDYLPEVLSDLGVHKQFHKVQQRPGKPFWFGTYDRGFVFAFPGNPVSTFMCATRYFEPWMWKNAGLKLKSETALLAEDFRFNPALQYFLQVKLSQQGSHLLATPYKGKGSGDLVNLAQVDAFLELPAERNYFKKNEEFRVWRIGVNSAI